MEKNKVTRAMLELLAQNVDTQTLINKATEIMDNPILVVDSNFRILAASTNIDVDVESWKEAMNNKYIAEDLILAMQEEKTIENLQNSEEPIFGQLPEEHSCIRMPLYCVGRYRGFLGMYDYNKSFGTHDGEKLQIISRAVCAHMQHNSFFNSVKGSLYDLFLYELLEAPDEAKGTEICSRYKALSFGKEKMIVLISRDTNSKKANNIPIDLMRSRLETVLFMHHSIEFNNNIVVALNMDDKPQPMIDLAYRTLKNFCEEYDLIAGISMRFKETECISSFYNQAAYALSRGMKIKNENEGAKLIYKYEDYILDDIIDTCLAKHEYSYYIPEVILKIQKYDEEYNTSYLFSLKSYLYNFGNMMKTAAELGIHYNTMKYRMKMVHEIANIDLEDSALRFKIYISCKILDRIEGDY